MPQEYNASEEWKGKKIVIVSVPGAFTPGCQANHLPPYIQNLDTLKTKGVDTVAVIAFNDSWVMSAWGKVNKVSGDDLVSQTDHLLALQFLQPTTPWLYRPANDD